MRALARTGTDPATQEAHKLLLEKKAQAVREFAITETFDNEDLRAKALAKRLEVQSSDQVTDKLVAALHHLGSSSQQDGVGKAIQLLNDVLPLLPYHTSRCSTLRPWDGSRPSAAVHHVHWFIVLPH
jgi:hypothetical protein